MDVVGDEEGKLMFTEGRVEENFLEGSAVHSETSSLGSNDH